MACRRTPFRVAARALPLLLIVALALAPAASRAADRLSRGSHPAIAFSHSGDAPPTTISLDPAVVPVTIYATTLAIAGDVDGDAPCDAPAAPEPERDAPRGPPSSH